MLYILILHILLVIYFPTLILYFPLFFIWYKWVVLHLTTHFCASCFSNRGYVCMVFYRREGHVIELQQRSKYKSRVSSSVIVSVYFWFQGRFRPVLPVVPINFEEPLYNIPWVTVIAASNILPFNCYSCFEKCSLFFT
jgi:hypothetical protein